jgi:hypothetical protein
LLLLPPILPDRRTTTIKNYCFNPALLPGETLQKIAVPY